MPYSSYPQVVNSDYSPSLDILAFQDPFETDDYTTSPDYLPSTFFDSDSFSDRPLTSIEMTPTGYSSKQPSFNPTLPATGISAADSQPDFQQTYFQTPFGQLDQYSLGYSLDPSSINSFDPTPFSPVTETSSRTPSLCGDAQQQAHSPPMSPPLVKREASFSPPAIEEETTSTRPLRKRGRPRLDRFDSDPHSTGSSSGKYSRGGRLPHNQVERKYREGLNSELERLRRTVPTLPQSDDGSAMGQPKPSKAMILSGAIDYIKQIEKERDALKEEVERLRQNHGADIGWTRADNSLDEFLMDP
jgi:hypothetical protein